MSSFCEKPVNFALGTGQKRKKKAAALIHSQSLYRSNSLLFTQSFLLNLPISRLLLSKASRRCSIIMMSPNYTSEYGNLSKIFHTRLEYLQILLAVNIHCNAVPAALHMRHLSEDAAVRRCNTLDGIV